MSKLSIRCTEENGLSFELLVDDEPLAALVGATDTELPYWIVEDGLPRWPPDFPSDEPDVRIIAVCSCGEYGCAHTRCRVTRVDDEVVFSEFEGDVKHSAARSEFRVPHTDYVKVCEEIAERARNQHNRDETSRL